MSRKARLVVGVAVAYVLGVSVLGRLQRQMVFPGPGKLGADLLRTAALQRGAEELQLTTTDGETLYGWHIPAKQAATRRVVLYFHGNASSVLAQADLQALLAHRGWDFVGIHYRGYPQSTGTPSEVGLQRDAKAAWEFVTKALGVPPGDVVIHGRSLGGGVAAQLASTHTPGALVLESTFASLIDTAKHHYPWLPVGMLLRERFDTASLAAQLSSPTLVLHGTADRTIPIQQAQALVKLLPNVQYIEVPNVDHNDPMLHGATAAQYLAFLDDAVPYAEKETPP